MKNKFNIKDWITASRPKTLHAAMVPVIVGSAVAYNDGKFFPLLSFIALLCVFLIQIGTNFTNDLYDYLKGADNQNRKGPTRVLSAGLISVREMKLAIFIMFSAAFLLGLYLVYSAGIIILIIGIISIAAGLAYTAGPYPLAYHALGDLFVFIFFGLIGTMGTYYLHQQEFSFFSFLAAVPVGALITNILIVNNYRDINEDNAAGKITLAVKLGEKLTRYQFLILTFISYLIPLFLYIHFELSLFILLPLLSIPVAVKISKMIFSYYGRELNKTLELTAKLSALFGFLFAAGIIL
jgi:1,4-dihydroxy-2-naphthoate polyprenyltransferase